MAHGRVAHNFVLMLGLKEEFLVLVVKEEEVERYIWMENPEKTALQH